MNDKKRMRKMFTLISCALDEIGLEVSFDYSYDKMGNVASVGIYHCDKFVCEIYKDELTPLSFLRTVLDELEKKVNP